jgi:hypothetical protein
MTVRMGCCVPFCKRTRGLRKGETQLPKDWICGPHWAGVPRRTKRRLTLSARFIRRELRRQPMANSYWLMTPGSPERIRAVRMWHLHERMWERCKRHAIEGAAGI